MSGGTCANAGDGLKNIACERRGQPSMLDLRLPCVRTRSIVVGT